jgi:hypothetical protein
MDPPALSDEDFALLADAVQRGAVRITLSTRGLPIPGGLDRLASAQRLRAAGYLNSGRKGLGPGASRDDDTLEFLPTREGRALVDTRDRKT